MTIQSTNLTSALNSAITMSSGDYLYVYKGVTVSTSGSQAVDGPASGNITIDDYGQLFGSFAGVNNQGTGLTSLHLGPGGSIDGVAWGVLLVAGGNLSIEGSVYGGSGAGIYISGFGTSYASINVAAGASVTSASFGMRLSGSADVTIGGTVGGGGGSGGNGILANSPTAAVDVHVLSGGSVRSGGRALSLAGSHIIENDGEISAAGAGSVGVYTSGAGQTLNTGSIKGDVAIKNFDAAAADVVQTVNTGTVFGSTSSYVGSASIERLINQGVMTGNIAFGSHDGSSIVNAGTINGNVTLGNGAGQQFDSALGRISGTVLCGAGGDVVVAGQTGGIVSGSVGNDTLYANQTQAAADNHARTTLGGAGGINALYGGGGFNTFVAGDANGGYNQIWAGASLMGGVAGYTNNTLDFSGGAHGVYVDLLNGHNAYVASGTDWTGTGTFEDAIINVPNVVGSSHGDLIQADNGTDRIAGAGGADALYSGGGQDTFVYGAYADSNLSTGYDTIVGFKLGSDKIDISALHLNGANVAISTAGTSNTVYLEQTPGTFNSATDLAFVVSTSTAGGLHASDFTF
jgi:hypothetical protein